MADVSTRPFEEKDWIEHAHLYAKRIHVTLTEDEAKFVAGIMRSSCVPAIDGESSDDRWERQRGYIYRIIRAIADKT